MPNTVAYLNESSGSSWERTLYASWPGRNAGRAR